MEVFLSNVPPHLTDRTLEKELRPYMNALGITEWSCSSKKDNRLGWVIFLYQEDANKFLRRHGKQSMAGSESTRIFSSRDSTSTGGGGRKGLRDKANLYLMRVPVFVTQSNKAPDPFALKSLTHRLQDKFNQRDAPDDNDSIKFAFTHLACGHNSFGGGQKALVFHQQYCFNQRGLSKFCKRMLVLKFDDAGKVEIPYSSVVEMIHSSQPTTFTLVLSEPPRFYSSKTDLQETMNRILRRFPNQTSYFIRVTFCDEDGGDLFFNPRVSYDQIFDRYREVLNGGIPIAGRIYQFLGFSHSSLRSHSAWFSAPFVDDSGKLQLYGNIIKALGDFEHIEIPAKCAARIGQAFSETPTFINLTENRIRHSNIPDVKSQDGDIERVFSDGVGTISQEVLELVWPRLPRGSLIPTCLQIRWGGVKGMLSLDSRLMGRTICVRRESMEKFPSNDVENLEICDAASRPLKLVLNRQMIKIMEDLGVDSDFFLQLQKKEVDRLRAVTADAYNTGTFLHLQGVGSTFFFPGFIKSLENYGIDYRRDSFLRAIVESTVLQELRLLKHKARIPVPEGATLFGIMDETGFLREGEVYVCYDTYKRPGKSPIKNSLRDGPVLVTRSPALHPGDIQYVNMRTPPPGHPLRNLRNCIAFSQRGHRDLPSMLSGGDLDGDLYNIIWDKAAAPKRTFKAADYPRVTPEPLGRPVERKDMANWFVDFMKSDVLGLIATRHLILSDQDPVGTLGKDCLKLAGLHSTAVDFSKTGVAVEPRDIPKAPQFRPDL